MSSLLMGLHFLVYGFPIKARGSCMFSGLESLFGWGHEQCYEQWYAKYWPITVFLILCLDEHLILKWIQCWPVNTGRSAVDGKCWVKKDAILMCICVAPYRKWKTAHSPLESSLCIWRKLLMCTCHVLCGSQSKFDLVGFVVKRANSIINLEAIRRPIDDQNYLSVACAR